MGPLFVYVAPETRASSSCWRSAASAGVMWAGVCAFLCIWREGVPDTGSSVGADLRDLRLGRLVGGLDEHGLGQLLSRRHRHLLDLIQLLQCRETDSRCQDPYPPEMLFEGFDSVVYRKMVFGGTLTCPSVNWLNCCCPCWTSVCVI